MWLVRCEAKHDQVSIQPALYARIGASARGAHTRSTRTQQHTRGPRAHGRLITVANVWERRELAARFKGTGVTSNSLEPGIVATNLSKGIRSDPTSNLRTLTHSRAGNSILYQFRAFISFIAEMLLIFPLIRWYCQDYVDKGDTKQKYDDMDIRKNV